MRMSGPKLKLTKILTHLDRGSTPGTLACQVKHTCGMLHNYTVSYLFMQYIALTLWPVFTKELVLA